MGAQQNETLPDMENRCNARTCKQQLTPSAELWKCCEKSRCKQYLTPSLKFRQPFWPDGQRCDFSAFAQKTALAASYPTTYLQEGKALTTALWVSTPRYLCPNSDLRPTPFWWGADCDAACAKRDERQFSKAAQARNCPMPDAFLVGYTEG